MKPEQKEGRVDLSNLDLFRFTREGDNLLKNPGIYNTYRSPDHNKTLLHIILINLHHNSEYIKAFIAENKEVVKELINIKDNLDRTPLEMALEEGSPEIAQILTDLGADPVERSMYNIISNPYPHETPADTAKEVKNRLEEERESGAESSFWVVMSSLYSRLHNAGKSPDLHIKVIKSLLHENLGLSIKDRKDHFAHTSDQITTFIKAVVEHKDKLRNEKITLEDKIALQVEILELYHQREDLQTLITKEHQDLVEGQGLNELEESILQKRVIKRAEYLQIQEQSKREQERQEQERQEQERQDQIDPWTSDPSESKSEENNNSPSIASTISASGSTPPDIDNLLSDRNSSSSSGDNPQHRESGLRQRKATKPQLQDPNIRKPSSITSTNKGKKYSQLEESSSNKKGCTVS